MKKKIMIIELISTLFISLFLAIFTFTFVLKPAEVNGESMYPTLHDKDKLLTDVFSTIFFEIERFDIVVIKTNNQNWVKRVIGLPNETIQVKDNILYINDEAVEQPFLDKSVITKDFPKVTLKADEYFVMGDNRNHSSDSRLFIESGNHFKKSQIISRHAYIYFPFDRMRYIK